MSARTAAGSTPVPKPGKRAVVFDLWGTLVPFPPGAFDGVLEQIAHVLDVPYPDLAGLWDETWSERATGDLASYLAEICVRLKLQPTSDQLERALAIRVDAHARLFVPREDAVPTLTRLRSLGIRTAVVTNCTSEVPTLWQRSSLAGIVDVQLFSCAEGVMKPDRRIYELATNRLAVEPEDCLYVGDGADRELDGARAIGMDALLLRPGDTNPPPAWSGPELVSLAQVLTWFDEALRA